MPATNYLRMYNPQSSAQPESKMCAILGRKISRHLLPEALEILEPIINYEERRMLSECSQPA
jgi:hypothetical protein